jgi:hypothetical protein
MVFVDMPALSQAFRALEGDDEKAAKKAYKSVLGIKHLETRVDAITHAARHSCWEKIAKKAFTDLCRQMAKSGEYSAEQQAGQMEDMVYLGCRIPSLRISAIEHILDLIEKGRLDKDGEGSVKFLDFVLEKTKDKESPTVLRAKRIRGL